MESVERTAITKNSRGFEKLDSLLADRSDSRITTQKLLDHSLEGMVRDYYSRDLDSHKIQKDLVMDIPEILDVVDSFYDEPLDYSKLEYSSVIADRVRFNNSDRDFITYSLIGVYTSGMAIGAGGIVLSIPTVSSFIVATGLGIILTSSYGITRLLCYDLPEPKGSTGAYEEYKKLLQRSENVDKIIQTEYKDHLVSKYLRDLQNE